MAIRQGSVRDAILDHMAQVKGDASVADIRQAVNSTLRTDVPPSSVRSYLNANTPGMFVRTSRGRYRLARR